MNTTIQLNMPSPVYFTGCLADLENLENLENRYGDLENLENLIFFQFDLENLENNHFPNSEKLFYYILLLTDL